ncbi:hypothetical protein H2198_003198 [Neophaeococcomyces mojaviensis]|uniref:Uncharacterized protein n=1 Tax=Neophaeococcomyces mojaviensis TaxID=3383035 RepID=A0ACC3AC14_9EURO|nr:hypothetical protein H2198_003198 [Knufia sp. JES_112]
MTVGKPKDNPNTKRARSTQEHEQIKQHLAQRHQKKRKVQKKLDLHPSINRILNQSSTDDDEGETSEESVMPGDSETVTTITGPASLNMNTIGTGALDPFTPIIAPTYTSTAETMRLLFLYCKHLRPLARNVHSNWDWIDNLAEIQASPLLSCAVTAYASAFFTGMKYGSRGVALPPNPERGRSLLWPIPAWFRLQTQALSLLNEALLDKSRALENDVFHTVVFLFRLAVLFGDGLTANMHYKALRQVAHVQCRDLAEIRRELAVTRVNFITVYLYKAALVMVPQEAPSEDHPDCLIEPDRSFWVDDNEWNKFSGMLFGRYLTWHARSPGGAPQEEASLNILRLDPTSARLSNDLFVPLVKTYQVALYLWSYLSNIAYDTTLPKIQLHVAELEQYLEQTDLVKLELQAPKVVFILFFVGAFASRGSSARKWFIEKLANAHIRVRYMRDVHAELAGFCDPIHVMPVLLEEILIEITQVREGKKTVSKRDLYQGEFFWPSHGPSPMSKTPDLETPIRHEKLPTIVQHER